MSCKYPHWRLQFGFMLDYGWQVALHWSGKCLTSVHLLLFNRRSWNMVGKWINTFFLRKSSLSYCFLEHEDWKICTRIIVASCCKVGHAPYWTGWALLCKKKASKVYKFMTSHLAGLAIVRLRLCSTYIPQTNTFIESQFWKSFALLSFHVPKPVFRSLAGETSNIARSKLEQWNFVLLRNFSQLEKESNPKNYVS